MNDDQFGWVCKSEVPVDSLNDLVNARYNVLEIYRDSLEDRVKRLESKINELSDLVDLLKNHINLMEM